MEQLRTSLPLGAPLGLPLAATAAGAARVPLLSRAWAAGRFDAPKPAPRQLTLPGWRRGRRRLGAIPRRLGARIRRLGARIRRLLFVLTLARDRASMHRRR